MKKNFLIALWFTLVTTMMFGVLYPLAITGLAQVLFPTKANGQLIILLLVVAAFAISPAAAEFQIPRVARERKMSEADLRTLVEKFTQERQFGIFGEPRVNVLELNLELDGAHPLSR